MIEIPWQSSEHCSNIIHVNLNFSFKFTWIKNELLFVLKGYIFYHLTLDFFSGNNIPNANIIS